jgi:transglutaminase-like putative cysteine protease
MPSGKYMKKGLLLSLLPVFLLASIAMADDNFFYQESLDLDISISNSIEIVPESSDYGLRKVQAELSFFPQSDINQEVSHVDIEPDYEESADAIVFTWKNPTKDQIDFTLDYDMVTRNYLKPISTKVTFPVEIDSKLKPYVQVTPTIDYTDKDIINLASDMAYGEDDLYVVVHKMGAWVHENIQYSLTTKNVEASQKASWVLENKEGVCDELTNLFIGLCRVLGVPARFVSGVSYTNTGTPGFSPHGWAEVYFPGYGWIPFDVTYGELGYIDAGHVKLKHALDANRSSTRYEWEGYNVDLEFGKLSIDTAVDRRGEMLGPLLQLDARMLKSEVGLGSYNAVVIVLENPQDYYVPTIITLSRSEGTEMLDDASRFVLMKPGEKREEAWIIKLDKNLNNDYIYTFTFKAFDSRNTSTSAKFTSTQGNKVYTIAEIRELLTSMEEEEEKQYSENLELACRTESQFYLDDIIPISCMLWNTGNVVLEGLTVCLAEECRTTTIYIGQTENMTFNRKYEEGEHDVLITAKNRQVSKSANARFSVWGEPLIDIYDIRYPDTVMFSQNFSIEFKIKPKTSSVPYNVALDLVTGSFKKTWQLEQLDGARTYILHVGDQSLTDLTNPVTIEATYYDKDGKRYEANEHFTIYLERPTLEERAVMLMNKGGPWLQEHLVMLVLSVFVSGLVLGVIFRWRSYK